jgi:hypothetical protein
LVFEGLSAQSSTSSMRGFADGLPRYEFKTPSIFPEAGKVASEGPSAPVRVHAQLRTVLHKAGVDSATSAAIAAEVVGRLEAHSAARRCAGEARALPSQTAGGALDNRCEVVVPDSCAGQLREVILRCLASSRCDAGQRQTRG